MILIYLLLRYLFQIVKYYEKVNITDRSMIVKLEISSPLNYSQILDQQKFRPITKNCQFRTIAPDFWLDYTVEKCGHKIKTDESI